MKMQIEMAAPEMYWVSVPVSYTTPIGDVGDEQMLGLVEDTINYLRMLDDIIWIINSSHQHVRMRFCRDIIRDRILKHEDCWYENDGEGKAEKLSHFLHGFRKATGWSFFDYKFAYTTGSSGRKVRLLDYPDHIFDSEGEAMKYHINLAVARCEYEVVE